MERAHPTDVERGHTIDPNGSADPTAEIIEHLFALVEQLRLRFEAVVSAYDLSAAQAKALGYLADVGPVPMRELACRLRCDASNVTGIIDRLEHRGLVERRAAPGDRRIKSLVVTARGQQTAAAVWADVRMGALGLFHLTDDERSTLLLLLRRLDASAVTT